MTFRSGRWWLTQDSRSVVVSATPRGVYDLVSDLPRMGEWSPECEHVEWTDGATGPAPGARFVGHNRTGPRRMIRWSRRGRVLTADPGREFSFVTEEGGRESTVWGYRFEPVEGGTRVTESYEVEEPVTRLGWFVIEHVFGDRDRRGALRHGMRTTLERLKVAAESGSGVSADQHTDAR